MWMALLHVHVRQDTQADVVKVQDYFKYIHHLQIHVVKNTYILHELSEFSIFF